MWFWNRRKKNDLAADLRAFGGMVFLGVDTDAGAVVDRETAMEISAVFACINALVQDVGQIPLPVYERLENDDRKKAAGTVAYERFKYGPNHYQTLQDWQEQVMVHLLTIGDYYARIGRVGGKFDALYPFENPAELTTEIVNGRKRFTHQAGDVQPVPYGHDDIFHIHAPSSDGYCGREFTDTHRQTLSLAKALYRYGAKFFANGGQPRGILVLPQGANKNMGEDAKTAAALFKEKYGGANVHEVAAYSHGTDWKPISVDPDKAQALESCEHVDKQIASLWRMPLWRLYGETPPTLEARRAYYTDTVRPWLVRIAGGANKQLLPDGKLYAEHNTAALLQADVETRMKAYQIAVASRIMNPNECRKLENLAGYPGGELFINPNVMSTEDTKIIDAGKGQSE